MFQPTGLKVIYICIKQDRTYVVRLPEALKRPRFPTEPPGLQVYGQRSIQECPELLADDGN